MVEQRIGIFLPSLAAGGAERVVLALAREFANRGHSVQIMVASDRGHLRGFIPENVDFVSFGVRKALHAVRPLVVHLRRQRFNCLLTTVVSANIAGLLAHRLANVPTRCVVREANPTEYDVRSASVVSTLANKLAVRKLYRHADALIAISRGVRDSLIDYVRVECDRVVVIPNPLLVGDATFDAPSFQREDSEVPLIAACGRLCEQKDYFTLLRGFALLRQRMPARLVIVGEGPLLDPLRAEVERLDVAAEVKFLGYHPVPVEVMRAAKVFAHTSRWEGFGLVLLEALASGCTVVATDCSGGVRDALGDGQYGLLVPPGDPHALADALEKALTGAYVTPEPREHLKKFDLGRIADQYLSVLLPVQTSARAV